MELKICSKQQHGHNNKYNHVGDCEPCCVPKFRSAAGESWWVSFMSVDTPNWMVEYGLNLISNWIPQIWIPQIWLKLGLEIPKLEYWLNCRGFPVPVAQCFPTTCVFQTTKTRGWPSLQSFSYVQSSSIKSRSLANMNSSFWWFPRLWPQWRWCWHVLAGGLEQLILCE